MSDGETCVSSLAGDVSCRHELAASDRNFGKRIEDRQRFPRVGDGETGESSSRRTTRMVACLASCGNHRPPTLPLPVPALRFVWKRQMAVSLLQGPALWPFPSPIANSFTFFFSSSFRFSSPPPLLFPLDRAITMHSAAIFPSLLRQ